MEKLRKENNKLKAEVKNLKELNKQISLGIDTKSQLMMPSEFKEKWQFLVQDQLLDGFPAEVFEDHDQLSQQVREIFHMVQNFISNQISEMIGKISGILGTKNIDHYVEKSLLEIMKTFSGDIFSPEGLDHNFDQALVNTVYDLCLFMRFNQLEIRFIEENQYVLYNKNKHVLIDGFSTEGPARVILPAPLINGRPYQGIKQAVLIEENLSQE